MNWVVCGLFLLPATAAAGGAVALAVIGRFPRSSGGTGLHTGVREHPAHRLTVLIPAHDEEPTLSRTLASVAVQEYPAARVLVVADNCTDDTTGVARRGGAECVERHDPTRRGKGHAVAFGLTHALADRPDAVLILDADCTVDPTLLARMSDELAAGAEAVQAAVVARADLASAGGYVAAVGAAVDHATAVGMDRLGLGVPLRGTGMLFRRELLERHPWAVTGLAEDAEYAVVLKRAGVRVRLAAGAAVRCDPPADIDALITQRRRWRESLRVAGSPFVSKPLVLAHLLLTAGVVTAFAPQWLGWLAVIVALTAGVYLPATARVGRPRLSALAGSFGVVARLALLTLGGFGRRERTWQRTPRS